MEMKFEDIGNVHLDYTDYPGEDLYSEGAEEDALLQIVKTHTKDEFNHIIAVEKRWSVLYHLSHLRGNIVDFLPIRKTHKVLEIGAGCGAITGTLAEKAAHVTCIELSRKRSLINAWRNKDADNIDILVGNFEDIEEHLDEKYDYIMLIGVLEYAVSYIHDKAPYEKFLQILTRHLAPGGQIVIAIENKYGMKYFAGCREDHTGRYFDGIEGYHHGGSAHTFSKEGLSRLFKKTGYKAKFFYPYPDYKLPMTIYSDDRLPSVGDFTENRRNFDGERITLFNESEAFDEALSDGYFPFFSNSYLVVLEKSMRLESTSARRAIYSKHSNERDPLYQIRTDIEEDDNHRKVVVKYPFTDEAIPHLEKMEAASEKIREEFKGTAFKPNKCKAERTKDGKLRCLDFEFLTGRSMNDELDLMRKKGHARECITAILNFAVALRKIATEKFVITDEFREIFQVKSVPGQHMSMKCTDLDMIFSNLIFSNGWNIIDYEWTFDFPIPVDFLIYRAMRYYIAEAGSDWMGDLDIWEKLSISEVEKHIYDQMEAGFQRHIAGRNISLVGMYSIFGGNNILFENSMKHSRLLYRPEHVVIYYDTGMGYSEENSCVINAARDENDNISFDTVLPEGCRAIRFDPATYPCMVKIENISLDGKAVEECLVNGTGISEHVILFDTDDSQIILEKATEGSTLHMEYAITRVDDRFWKPLAFEFAVPLDNEGSKWSHLIHGTRPEYVPVSLV